MRSKEEIREMISAGQAILGIELGSTRIKSVLIDVDKSPVASGSYDWENQYVNHIWTYDIDEIWKGLQGSYQDLVKNVQEEYGVTVTNLAAAGVSAMMHGYLAFDENDELLVPFRTWRNTITGQAYSSALEYCPSVSGGFKRRGSCGKSAFLYNTCRIYSLEADRTESDRKR